MGSDRVSIRNSEPIFPVADIVATVRYYRDVLGFAEEWVWGEPPDFGGVRWGKIGAMFALQPGRAANIGGQWHSFVVSASGRVLRTRGVSRPGKTLWDEPEY